MGRATMSDEGEDVAQGRRTSDMRKKRVEQTGLSGAQSRQRYVVREGGFSTMKEVVSVRNGESTIVVCSRCRRSAR